MLLNKKCVSNSYILIYFGFLTKTTIIDLYTVSWINSNLQKYIYQSKNKSFTNT